MSIISKGLARLTVTPLLYALAAMVILSGVLGFNLKLANAAKATAQADKNTAVAEKNTAITERDAWKAKTADAQAANAAYAAIFDKQQQIAADEQRQAEAATARAQRIAATARADEARAERELADFRKRFAGKPATCASALQAMQNACPTLGDY